MSAQKIRQTMNAVLSLLFPALIALLFSSVLLFRPEPEGRDSVETVLGWSMDGKSVQLPQSFSHLSPRTSLTLTAQIQPQPGDYLYIKAVYTPVKLYVDGQLIFRYGQDGDFPAFLLDPPTKTALVALPETDRAVTLTLEYLSPSQRDVVTLYPVLLGNPAQILSRLFSEMWFSLFFSVALLILGLILALISLALTRFEKSGIAFFWLGLFSLCTGGWAFGECNLTGLFIDSPPFLYLPAFLGLFTLAIPLLRFGLAVPSVSEKLPPACRNETVNAVVLHYQAMAIRSGITDCSVKLDIPEETGRIPIHALCLVIGNLLENAVTACAGAEAPFIRMRGRLADGILTIVMDNRYTDIRQTPEGDFYSTKPGGGIGLWSICSVAEKYGGGCRFEAADTVFSSSVYLLL